jgi:hypothetical protein
LAVEGRDVDAVRGEDRDEIKDEFVEVADPWVANPDELEFGDPESVAGDSICHLLD